VVGWEISLENKIKKKFKIIDASTGHKFKLTIGQMIIMNSDGVFMLVGGMNDYYLSIKKLSDVCPRYDVVWLGEDK